ncbi:MAG: YvcK family protein [Psychrilyobacter sp.]|nr:YvcK family protein [Psychrilyobacter sp.]
MENKPKVVVLGGGTGLSNLLRGLKYFPLDITAIVTVADDGGSSGRLRDEFNIPAPGDIRNVMIALSEFESKGEELLNYRFKGNSDLAGHPVGNLMLAAMINMEGNIVDGIKALNEVIKIKGTVLPATSSSCTLVAEMEDGEIVVGESKIPNLNKKIKRVFFNKKPKAVIETIKAIDEAEMIIVGIGSLYTSILPNLIIDEIKEAILRSSGKKIYVSNAMEQPGETTGYSVGDHIQTIYDHVGGEFFDTVIVNSKKIPSEILKKYKEQDVKEISINFEELKRYSLKIVSEPLIEISEKQTIRHHPLKLASAIYSLILGEIKL